MTELYEAAYALAAARDRASSWEEDAARGFAATGDAAWAAQKHDLEERGMVAKLHESAYPHREFLSRPYHAGLTKREHFAGLAMQGLLANLPPDGAIGDETTANKAVELADALLAALNE